MPVGLRYTHLSLCMLVTAARVTCLLDVRFAQCACGQTFWSAGHRGTPRARGPPHMGQIPKRRKPTHDQVQDLVLNAMGAAARRRGRGDHDPVRERPRGTFWTIFQDLWIKYLHYARHTVQGLRSLNLSRNGDELERPCEHRAQPAMPRRVLRQH